MVYKQFRKKNKIVQKSSVSSYPSENELNKLELEFFPPLLEIQETPPPYRVRLLMWTLISLIFSFIAWSVIFKIDVITTAPGRIVPDGKIKTIQSADPGVVTAINVHEGQYVKKGEVLFETDPKVSDADRIVAEERVAMLKLDLARLKAESNGTVSDYSNVGARQELIVLQQALRSSREAGYAAKLAEAQNTYQSKELLLAAANDNLKKIESSTRIASDKESRVRPHVGFVMSQFEYLKLKDELAQDESDLAAQRNLVRDAYEQKSIARARITQLQQERQTQIVSDISDATTKLSVALAENSKAAQASNRKQILAPVDGQILSMAVNTVGAVLSPSQNVGLVVPSGTLLIIESIVSNEDIGFIKLGQKVMIKIDTFPFQRYGTLEGKIVSISPDAEPRQVSSDEKSATVGMNEYIYKVHIKLNPCKLQQGHICEKLLSGMTVQAEIKTDNRRLVSFLFDPIVKYFNEGLNGR